MMEFALRKWEPEDAQTITKYANNPKIANHLRDGFPSPYTLADAEEFVESCIHADESRQFCRAVVINGEAVGSIGVFLKDDVYCKSAEIGYWLGEPFWWKGIMSCAIRQVCAEVFRLYPEIVRIYAQPYAINAASRRALEKAGFALEGLMKKSVYKNGRVMDSCMYALLRQS